MTMKTVPVSRIAFIDDVTIEAINGATWAIGTAAGGYVHTFSFSTDFPTDFDYADFARVFAQRVTVRS